MGTMMESRLTPEQHALIRTVLVAQTESVGLIEAPIVEGLLREHRCRSVLDVGCGEGSFLLRLARQMKGVRFVGVDHSPLAVADALSQTKKWSLRNVTCRTGFFDARFERRKYDAVLTRYTLQHASDPSAFVAAVRERLRKRGVCISVESLDAYSSAHEDNPVWKRFRVSLAAIHRRGGSNEDIGKSLGWLFAAAGFRDIRVQVVLCSPSTVGWKRFRAVVQASAETAASLCPDVFDRTLLEDVKVWVDDQARLEGEDPYLCTAIASGTKP